jgi:para-nitrobenzyl esterase
VAAEPIAETAHGRLRGRRATNGLVFAGIRYARASRFAAPVAVPSWAGVADALVPGPAAPQPDRPVGRFTHGPTPAQSEDCLHLNVHTPALTGARPVLVWIHGGGFTIGHGSASIYRGDDLAAAADAVVVTLNYRLGSLGWLAHPDLAEAAGAPAANWGLLDQLAAVRWVGENIAGFGGDPGRVTLAGQSAGALSALDLLEATDGARPFHRVVLQSPPLFDAAQPVERGVRWAEALRAAAGAGGLRTLPADRVVALHEELLATPAFQRTRGGALPTLDPATIAVSPAQEPGVAPAVEVLIGCTAAEGTFFFGSPWRPAPPADRVAEIVSHLPGIRSGAETLERYAACGDSPDSQALLIRIATDAMFTVPVAEWAQRRAAAGARVFRYRVDHPGGQDGLGATHTVEVPLLFGTFADGGAGQRLGGADPDAATVAPLLQQAWARFLHGEDPGWQPVTADGGGQVGVFGGRSAMATVAAGPCPAIGTVTAS